MKKLIVLGFLFLLLVGGCAPTKEMIIKDWTLIAEKPSLNTGERWVYSEKDSEGRYYSNVVTEYLGPEEKHGQIYHAFTKGKRRKAYFTEDFHWAITSAREKEEWRDFEFFDPPNKFFMFPLQVGKSWQHDLNTARISGDPPKPSMGRCVKERKVVDYVRIEIKGKSYEAYKIEENCKIHKTKQVIWYAPAVKNWVKRILYRADGSWWQEELTNYEPK